MTEDVTDEFNEIETTEAEEMAALKERAKLLGVRISPRISLDALRKKVNAAVSGESEEDDEESKNADSEEMTPQQKKVAIREKMKQEQMALVRLRITNLNPDKSDLPGEIFTVANKYLGNVKKFIPYGEATDEGYHVPRFIYEQMKTRKFLQKRTKENPRTGSIDVKTSWVQEFALEELPQLTKKELSQLANQQRAAQGLAD